MIPLTLESGQQGEAVALEGEQLRAVLPRAFAPGAPIRFVARTEAAALSLRAKTVRSQRRPDGRYDVRLRLLSLRREERAALAEVIGAARPGS